MAGNSNRKPFTLKVLHEGREVPMELDTGSAVSVMSEGLYHKSLCHVPLKDTTLNLRTYTGEVHCSETTWVLCCYSRIHLAVEGAPNL